MSQPRVTITLGSGGKRVERHVSSSAEMYADRANGASNKKRSIRDRLGGLTESVYTAPQSSAKRQRDIEGQWKHDMFFDERDNGLRGQPGRPGGQDLRSKLARQGLRANNQGKSGNVVDLRDKLSGVTSQNHQTTQAQEAPKVQRRVASVVYNSSNFTQGVTSTTAPAPVSSRPTAAVKRPSVSVPEEQTVRTLLQSLGLEKYLITFQAEEIDMAALRFMSENDLKELGVPMGPRKKILLAIRGKE